MPISNPAINNPRSGSDQGLAQTEHEVSFEGFFYSPPHVLITPFGEYDVWVVDVDMDRFTWNNNKTSGRATIHWIADMS